MFNCQVFNLILIFAWYRIWSDGWIEQGGWIVYDFTLLKPYSNNNYGVVIGRYQNGNLSDYAVEYMVTKTTTQIKMTHTWNGGYSNNAYNYFYAYGY